MDRENITKSEAAFDADKVSKEFFRDYRAEFENAKPLIKNNSNLTKEDDIHQATQILFNRILFLRFIEKKGWLKFGESDDYLRELLKAGGLNRRRPFRPNIRRTRQTPGAWGYRHLRTRRRGSWLGITCSGRLRDSLLRRIGEISRSCGFEHVFLLIPAAKTVL